MSTVTPIKRPRGRPRSATPKAEAPAQAKGLDRSLAILEIVAGEDGLSLSDIAMRAGVAPSTTHRILATLEAHRFIRQDEERDLWLIGVAAFQIGTAFLRNRKFVEIGRPTMRDLMKTTGESVNLAFEDDGDIVFISQVESHSPIRSFHRPGTRGAIHASGVGKALLATMSDDAVETLLQAKGLTAFTEKTLTSPDALFEALKEVRMRGWAVDDEERMLGMTCVAAAIYNEYGEAAAGVSISGPTARMSAERIGELGPLVKRAAAHITDASGGKKPGGSKPSG